MSADGYVSRVKLFCDHLDVGFIVDIVIRLHLDTGRQDRIDIPLQTFSRQSVVRNSIAKHAAQLASLLEDRRFMSHNSQEICCGKSSRTASDNGNFLACIIHSSRNRHCFTAVIYSIALDSPDVYSCIDQLSSAPCLARMFADMCTDCRERIVLSDQSYGIVVSACHYQSCVSRHVYAGRTKCHARYRLLAFLDTGRAAIVTDVFLVILAESIQSPQHHAGRLCTNSTVCRLFNDHGSTAKQFQLLHTLLFVQV